MTGETIKTLLEDVCDNLFNPDPYYQQGGDMVRVGGLSTRSIRGKDGRPHQRHGTQGQAPRGREELQGRRLGAGVRGSACRRGEPVWDVVARHLRAQKTIKPRALNLPKVAGVAGNPGMGSGRI